MMEESHTSRSPLEAALHEASGEMSFTPIVGSSGMSYRPFMEIGRGGMARVLLARAKGPSGFTKLVVLKTIRRDALANIEVRQMFLAEARLCARLNHPNLVQVYEVNLASEAPCLVMEYLDGKPLSALLSGTHLPKRMLLSVISEVLSGLHHAHELRNFDGSALNIVHRDVSPHNVFVTYDGAAKILDFGIARMATAVSETATGEVKGKLTYMAPEQLLGEELDRRADIFAVGSILWEAAVGKRLWENVSEATLMHRLASGDIPRPSQHVPVDPTLEHIIVKATAPHRSERYRTAAELQRDLDEFLARSGGRVSTRDVGLALGEAFKEERELNADAIRRSLQQSLPPPDAGDAGRESEPDLPKSRGGRWVSILFVLIAALAAGTAIARWGLPKVGRETPAQAPPARSVTIVVRARPPTATIEIDGKAVGSRATTLRVLPDQHEHAIRVAAPGHATETRLVKFDYDRELDISLRELSLEPEPSPESTRPAPSAARPNRVVRTPSPGWTKPVPSASPPSSSDTCKPPYFFKDGIKTYKPECL